MPPRIDYWLVCMYFSQVAKSFRDDDDDDARMNFSWFGGLVEVGDSG